MSTYHSVFMSISFCIAVHEVCGRRHSYGMECNGSWMTLTRFESLAARWSSSKMNRDREI